LTSGHRSEKVDSLVCAELRREERQGWREIDPLYHWALEQAEGE